MAISANKSTHMRNFLFLDQNGKFHLQEVRGDHGRLLRAKICHTLIVFRLMPYYFKMYLRKRFIKRKAILSLLT